MSQCLPALSALLLRRIPAAASVLLRSVPASTLLPPGLSASARAVLRGVAASPALLRRVPAAPSQRVALRT